MSDRDQPKAAQEAGASLMSRVDAAYGAGWTLAGLPDAAQQRQDRASEPGHREESCFRRRQGTASRLIAPVRHEPGLTSRRHSAFFLPYGSPDPVKLWRRRHISVLMKGVDTWNQWRRDNPRLKPDLSGVGLNWQPLSEVNFRHANLLESDLRWADLRGANLRKASLIKAVFRGTNLQYEDSAMTPVHRVSASLPWEQWQHAAWATRRAPGMSNAWRFVQHAKGEEKGVKREKSIRNLHQKGARDRRSCS